MKKEKIITFGEIMLRLTPPDYNTIDQTHSFIANYGGGEANVAVALSHLGHKTYFMSKLPPNQLGDSAIKHLRGHGVNTDYVVRGSTTVGIYFLEPGFGGRPSKVIYNRKHSAITRVEPSEFDFDAIFADATWFHISGISLALGERVRKVALEAAKAAVRHNVPVSFDFNYRAKLWSIEDAKPAFQAFMPYVDVAFASYFDASTILDIPLDPDLQLASEEDKRKNVIQHMIKKYDLTHVFGTDRTVYSTTENALRAYCYTKNDVTTTEEIRFHIYDRIGGGDAFASGIIHGLIQKKKAIKDALLFGLVTSVLKHTIYGDACTVSCEDVENYIRNAGKSGVLR